MLELLGNKEERSAVSADFQRADAGSAAHRTDPDQGADRDHGLLAFLVLIIEPLYPYAVDHFGWASEAHRLYSILVPSSCSNSDPSQYQPASEARPRFAVYRRYLAR